MTQVISGLLFGGFFGIALYAYKNPDKVLEKLVEWKYGNELTTQHKLLVSDQLILSTCQKSPNADYYWYFYNDKNYISLTGESVSIRPCLIDDDTEIEELVLKDENDEVVELEEGDVLLMKSILTSMAGPGCNFELGSGVPTLKELKEKLTIISSLLENVSKIIVNNSELDEFIIS